MAVCPVWECGGHFAFLGVSFCGAILVRDVPDGCGDGCRWLLQSLKWADGDTRWGDIAKGQRTSASSATAEGTVETHVECRNEVASGL